MSTITTQLSCFASIHRNLLLHHHRRSISAICFPPKLSIVMSVEGHDAETSSFKNMPNLKYTANSSTSNMEEKVNSYPELLGHVHGKIGVNGPPNSTITEKGAKIHDFCFGIPFGGFVVAGGLVGSIFSRNLATLASGVLFGGAILALSTISLKVWRQGKTCIPFTLGQAVLAAALLWKNYQAYSLSNKLFPSGVNSLISGAMLLFYSYVVISGGNPPPKKSQYAASAAS